MKLSELIDEIKTKSTKTNDWNDPSFLSNLMLELSSYYSTLGGFLADAENDSENAEKHWKITEAQRTLELIEAKSPVSRAEEQAKVDTAEERQIAIDNKHKARVLFIARQSLALTIDTLGKHLSYIKFDKEASRNAT